MTALAFRCSTWEAILIALFPKHFDSDQAKDMLGVVALIRRAGYPYNIPGEFYVAAISKLWDFDKAEINVHYNVTTLIFKKCAR